MLAVSGLVTNIIVGLIVALILGLALWYIISQKKKGNKCIGCPHAKSCTSCGGKKESTKEEGNEKKH